MKVIPFKVPQTSGQLFRVQVDELPHFYDQLHQHDELQIMLIEKSSGTLVAGDYVGRFNAGDLFVLGENQPHVFRNDETLLKLKKGRQARSISLYFTSRYFGKEFWNSEEAAPLRKLATVARGGIMIEGKTSVEAQSMIRELSVQKNLKRLVTFLNLIDLLAGSKEFKKLSALGPAPGEDRRMNHVIQFSFKESHREIYINEVAAVANLTPEAFCRYFKLRTGKTYTNFLNEVRVSKARQLLMSGSFSIQEVCFDSGFSNVSNFNRVFKRVTGRRPGQVAGLFKT